MAETPEQIRLRPLATARQRQADAEAADTAEINAAAGVNDAVDGGALKEGARAFGEDVVGTLDLPTRAANFIRNVPALTTNAGIEAAQKRDAGAAQGSWRRSGYRQPAARGDGPVPRLQQNHLQQLSSSPDPNHPEARKVGNIAGSVLPAIVAPELLAGRLPSIIPTVADTASRPRRLMAAARAGRAIDEALGGSGDTGEFFGQLARLAPSPPSCPISPAPSPPTPIPFCGSRTLVRRASKIPI